MFLFQCIFRRNPMTKVPKKRLKYKKIPFWYSTRLVCGDEMCDFQPRNFFFFIKLHFSLYKMHRKHGD
jgi:hypothetical protein